MSKSRRPDDEFRKLKESSPFVPGCIQLITTLTFVSQIPLAKPCIEVFTGAENILPGNGSAQSPTDHLAHPKDNIASDRDKPHPSGQPREPTLSRLQIILRMGKPSEMEPVSEA
ncbi:hypothetical protein N7537_006324 [Penicillium hordei]|uniref:Uncharacterized protein n=1 Tax=Penicillium hordei TaxID=40994 RepID=A0AAD6H2Z6_9EURO|nr:uncharacterized protein N7537_006324 [Penicillium hordei]KAJ5603368.1 hypothetical protein N7537_006324 [Penicillium hordei]